MSINDLPIGKRFSHVYLSSPELMPDSKRMRIRIGNLIGDTYLSGFGDKVSRELGIHVAGDHYRSWFWPKFCEKLELRDMLDLLTVRYRTLSLEYYDSDGTRLPKARSQFLQEARRIFTEEGVRYRIDDQAGVHFAVDSEFENSRISTLSNLGGPRYAAARCSFEEA